MSRVIMLLPDPDNLQLANCYKYISRQDNTYSEIYTMTTIRGRCAGVDKILVIGHGSVGGFEGATVDELAAAIIGSGISLTGNKKVGFDTCLAANRGDFGNVSSALHLVRVRLKKHNFDCNLQLSGATGCSVTIGKATDKRLVVNPSKVEFDFKGKTQDPLGHAGDLQTEKVSKHNADLFGHRGDWNEAAPSSQIKVWAQAEYAKLIGFALDFRTELELGPYLENGPHRKATLQV
jgi:hypothetical protein